MLPITSCSQDTVKVKLFFEAHYIMGEDNNLQKIKMSRILPTQAH